MFGYIHKTAPEARQDRPNTSRRIMSSVVISLNDCILPPVWEKLKPQQQRCPLFRVGKIKTYWVCLSTYLCMACFEVPLIFMTMFRAESTTPIPQKEPWAAGRYETMLRVVLCVCISVCVCACIHACAHVCMRACVRGCLHACVRACFRACVHV